MTSRSFYSAILIICSMLFATAKDNNEKAVVNHHSPSKPGVISTNGQQQPRFDQRKVEQQKKTIEKIARQRTRAKQVFENMRRAGQNLPQKKTVVPHQLEHLKLFGKETKFYRAPGEDSRVMKNRSNSSVHRATTANLLVNGKTSDTLFFDALLVLTFSFAPDHPTAKTNIYVDMDNNGEISDADYLLRGFVIDNSDDDENPSDGEYKTTMNIEDELGDINGTFIFEVDDFQSVSTALVRLQQKPTHLVLQGSILPESSGVVCSIRQGNDYYYVITDSAGKFSSYLDTSRIQEFTVRTQDVKGRLPLYIPPFLDPITITSETTSVQLHYSLAESFVEGHIKDQDGQAVQNAEVMLGKNSDDFYAAYTVSDAAGYYKLGAEKGSWILIMIPPPFSEYLNYNNSSQIVSITGPGTTTHDFMVYKANNTISGHVFYHSSALAGVPVSANNYDNTLHNLVLSGPDGKYHMPVYGPVTESYMLSPSILSGYVISPSSQLAVPGEENVDFQIWEVNGGIRGTVTDLATGKPIPDAYVYVSGFNYASTNTNDSGFFQLSIVDGSYTLYASASLYHDYQKENIAISGSKITLNIQMQRSGSISGIVKDVDGKMIYDANITVYDSSKTERGNDYSDPDGIYVVGGLSTANYTAFASKNGYVPQWYNNTFIEDSATVVPVVDGIDTPNINFVLSRGGSISGKVMTATGEPINDATVVVYDSSFNYRSYAGTNDSGYYTATGLTTGRYLVEAYSTKYFAQWYSVVTNSFEATPVNVVVDQNTKDIDFTLAPGSSISGSVKDINNSPIEYAGIFVLDSTMDLIDNTYTDFQGFFEINLLQPAKKYFIYANKSGYARRWYNNVRTADSAAPVILLTGEEKKIDFMLPPAGGLSGKVFNKSGDPVQYVSVSAYNNSETYYGYTDQFGEYLISDLSGVEYHVSVQDFNYHHQWYDHKSSADLADPVPLVEGSNVPNINFDLIPITDNMEMPELLPKEFALKQNYPNPFNPSTIIAFDLPMEALVSVKIFNVLGQAVATLVDETLPSGRYLKQWNASSVGSGIYFYTIRAGSYVRTKKMLLVK